ncbi:MAG TPA: 50S ribosomal protein L20 [Candidatus Gastranaerophilales bacterium]|nr:50S ribosomal protein L20 [Candidatus Gastranaerophilales bacterium]
MPRVKRGNVLRKRHKKVLKYAKSFKSARSRLFIVANQAVMKALKYQYRDRRNKKRNFRRLWITRINAAARMHGINYSNFIKGLADANIIVNRKMLADIAVKDPIAFKMIADLAKTKVSA